MNRPPQWTPQNAARFRDETVVAAYHLRLPSPPAVFAMLRELVPDRNLPVLDLGTGTGELAREIAPWVMRVDAVDSSPTMIERLREMPGGSHPALRPMVSTAEAFTRSEIYGLITAGDSLHWMDWDTLLPQCTRLLAPGGFLAIVHRTEVPPPWQAGLLALIADCSTSRDYETFDLIAELERRGLYEVVGRFATEPYPGRPSIDDYIESFHSRSSLSRDHMPPAAAEDFDRRLRALVEPWRDQDHLQLETVGEIVWGYPLAGPTPAP